MSMEIDRTRYKLTKKTAHQILVDKIIEVVGKDKKYNYVYWLGRISRSKLSPNQILDLLDKAKKLSLNYNKGGFISKRL